MRLVRKMTINNIRVYVLAANRAGLRAATSAAHTRTRTHTQTPVASRAAVTVDAVAVLQQPKNSTSAPDAARSGPTFASLGVHSALLGRLSARLQVHTPVTTQIAALPLLMGRGAPDPNASAASKSSARAASRAHTALAAHGRASGAPERPCVDVCVCAHTGSGKTLAYLLPALSHAHEYARQHSPGQPFVLILTPTRELAEQVSRVCVSLCTSARMRARAAAGEGDAASGQMVATRKVVGEVSAQAAHALMHEPTHVCVCTPRTAHTLMERGLLNLGQLRYLVLDEADELVRSHNEPYVTAIVARTSRHAHVPARVCVSATLSDGLMSWMRANLRTRGFQLLDLTTTESTRTLSKTPLPRAAPGLAHSLLHVPTADAAFPALVQLFRAVKPAAALIFANSSASLEAVEACLTKGGIRVGVLGAAYTGKQRHSAIEGLNDGRLQAIVATEMAARGLDLPVVSHVINFDLPHSAREYVHRVGRAGRLSSKSRGHAISIAAADAEVGHVIDIAKQLNVELSELQLKGDTCESSGTLFAPASGVDAGAAAHPAIQPTSIAAAVTSHAAALSDAPSASANTGTM